MRVNLRLMLSFEAPNLDPVTADLHVAPPACVIFAGIQKEPAALQVGAGVDTLGCLGCQQFRSGLHKYP